MKILTVCVLSALALVIGTSAYAADANKNVVTRDYSDTVMPAQQNAYEAGVKAWNKCLRDHGAKYNVIALTHETGDVYEYSYIIGPYTWADFDRFDEQSKPCDAVWRAEANPHLKKETSNFFVDQPELSHLPADWRNQPTPPMYSVIYFKLKLGHAANEAFTEAVKKITAAAAKTKSSVYYRTMAVQGAGDADAPDYVLALLAKDWAEYGKLTDSSPWEMVEGVYGKAATADIRKSLSDAIAKSSDHADRYNADLSYIAGK